MSGTGVASETKESEWLPFFASMPAAVLDSPSSLFGMMTTSCPRQASDPHIESLRAQQTTTNIHIACGP
eukprot:3923888-Amphidinium_carterae.1